MPGERIAVTVAGVPLELSNLDKMLYPAARFTKGEVVDYYTRIAPVLLPHLENRPLTRVRYPDGVAGAGFFEKNAPTGVPEWVRTARLPVPGSAAGREWLDYVVADDLPTLVWLANLAALELHVPQWTVSATADHDTPRWTVPGPDRLVVDLDPGPPAGLAECAAVALLVRDRLAADGLAALPKTSGRKGMQVMCALDATLDADAVTGYARRVARELERAYPDMIVSRMARNLRPGKVFIDWSQNRAAKTTIAPYSLRAGPAPTVSAPLTWVEVESGRVGPVEAGPALQRVDRHGDLLAALFAAGPPRCPAGD